VPGYQFDLPAALRLGDMIGEYGRMRRLEGMSPQARGQRLNEFVAELLRYWGLDGAEAGVRGAGEIDVAFAADGTRFVLEAKWEHAPVGFGPIAKLSRRITQRLAGTRGVFLSMSGYTADALSDAVRGQQPDTLLLDRTHLEAMLSIWSAVWLSGQRFWLAGDGHFGVVDLGQSAAVSIDPRLRSPHPDQRGAARVELQRKCIRQVIEGDGISAEINSIVKGLLDITK
jgi:hypothetical protein